MSETKISQFTYEDVNGNKYTMEAGGGTIYTISLVSGAYGTIIGGTKIMEGGTQEVIIEKPSSTSDYEYVLPEDATSIITTNSTLVKVDTNLINEDYLALHITQPSNNVTINPLIEKHLRKGKIIRMDLGNTTSAYGTLHQYRILKNIGGSKYLVVAMYEPTTSQVFNPSGSGQTYSGSSLDTYLNSTWYNTLSTAAKSAIVSQTITQYKYSSGSTSTSHMSYATYSSKATVGSLSRYVYALDVEDIEEYFGGTAGSVNDKSQGTFTTSDLMTLFYKSTTTISGKYFWLRSANSSISYYCWGVNGSNGCVDGNDYGSSSAVRPAFTIDLSMIDYSIVE